MKIPSNRRTSRLVRVRNVCDQFIEWDQYRQQLQFPRSLSDIIESALKYEYKLGYRACAQASRKKAREDA